TCIISLPVMWGSFGSCYALLHLADEDDKVLAIDYNGVAPLETDHALFTSQEGKRRGILAPTVPGAIKGWHAVHDKCGVLPWAELREVDLYYAENGWQLETDNAGIIN